MSTLDSTVALQAEAEPAGLRDSLLRRILTPTPHFELAGPGDTERDEVERLVAEKFAATWQAQIEHFLPWLLSLHCLGCCSAVAGIRPAGTGPLFLEQYLEQPVEQVLAASLGTAVRRRDLVEIGNLVASQRGASHLLFLVLSATLHRAGYRWIVFTATRPLRNNLAKLGFPLQVLAAANPQRLDAAEREHWGRYYDSEPLVVAGSLDLAVKLMNERPLMRRVLRLYRYRINYLAELLREA